MVSKTELGFRPPADESMRRNAPPATPRYAGFGDGPPPRSIRSGRSRLAGAVPGNDVALSCATPPTGVAPYFERLRPPPAPTAPHQGGPPPPETGLRRMSWDSVQIAL